MHRLNLILLILAIARFLWASAFHQNTVYTTSILAKREIPLGFLINQSIESSLRARQGPLLA